MASSDAGKPKRALASSGKEMRQLIKRRSPSHLDYNRGIAHEVSRKYQEMKSDMGDSQR
jgi:hypothetical protein